VIISKVIRVYSLSHHSVAPFSPVSTQKNGV
jgi:hypothetical protein